MLNYADRGTGPALVFLHAYPLDRTMWAPQADFFSQRYRVITPDITGFGHSQPPSAWTMSEMGEELQALLDALDVEQCTLVGLSMGGYIALPFTVHNPHRVERLVLAHTRARADNQTEKSKRTEMIEALEKYGISSLPDVMLSRLLGPAASEDVQERVRKTILTAPPEAAIFAVTAMRERLDVTPHLQRIACPTLVVAGTGDSILTVEDCKALADSLPQGKLAVITNAGHLSNLENPAGFNRTLDEFLR